MVELLTMLTHLNLVELNSKSLSIKELVSIKLLKTVQFVEDDYEKHYKLDNLNDVEMFASDLALHGSRNDCKKCTFDSRLYIHNPRNWSYLPKLHRNLHVKDVRRFARLRNVIEEDANSSSSNNNMQGKKVNNSNKFSSAAKRKSAASKKQSKPKRRKLTATTTTNELKDKNNNNDVTTNNNQSNEELKDNNNNESQSANKPQELTKKLRRRGYDKQDMNALSLLRKQRSEWSKEEDSFLLMCRVASIILHPTCVHFVCVSKNIIRDELNKYLPNISFDKTSKACQRRIMYMLKNPRTKAHVLDWVAEVKQDFELSTIRKPKVPITHTEEWNKCFVELLHRLLKKFQNEHFISASNSNRMENFKTLDAIYKRFNLIESEIHCIPQKPILYFQPNNIVDVYLNVVLNVISSSLLINLFDNTIDYNNRSTLTLFKIYQRYPGIYSL